MKKLILLSIIFLLAQLHTNAQEFDWAQSYLGPGDQVIRDMAGDALGNVYVLGEFNDSIDLDPTANTNIVASAGNTDIFFAKIDSEGVVQWIKTIGAANNELGRSITVDNNGNVIICGAFTTLLDFDPGAGTTSLSYVGTADGFVAKYDNSGNFIWVRQQGGVSEEYTNGVACDAAGNVFITGYFYSTADMDLGQTNNQLTSAGQKDVFIVKFNSNGVFQWTKSIGGTSFDAGMAIAVDNSGNPVVTGFYQSTVDLNPGAGLANVTSAGSSDIFAVKLDTAGNHMWSTNGFLNSLYQDEPYAVHVGSDDKVYVCGHTNTFNVGIAVRMDANGIGEKYIALHNPSLTPGHIAIIKDIKTDDQQNLYITGHFEGTIDLDADTGTVQQNIVTAVSSDVFVAKYDITLAEIWTYYNVNPDAQNNNAIVISPQNSIYLAGMFYNSMDCDYAAGTPTLAAQAGADAQVHRIRQAAPVTVTNTLKETTLSLYPNPAGAKLFIEGGSNGDAVHIYSADGRLMKKATINNDNSIDIADLALGLYFIRVNNATGKFLKQ